MDPDSNAFHCPECGAFEQSTKTQSTPLDPSDPWGGIFPTVRCGECHQRIPVHLAKRWHGLSYQQAQMEWRQLYRPPDS